MMASTALVYMMTPALAFFYGGLVENKNILNQLFLSFICMAIVTVQWCLFGFSFAFGPGNNAFGSFQFGALRFPYQNSSDPTLFFGEGVDSLNSPTFPILTFAAYQAAFAVVTPALISGAVVGRMKLLPYMLFIFLWSTFCYDPLARWVFSNQGWLHQYGSLDFAGGTVVHISSGVSGFVSAIILGKRHDYDPKVDMVGHNIPFTVLGAGLLWIGWIGFNGGSALAANGIAALAMTNTNTAAASALLTWVLMDAIRGTISVSGGCSAVVVGLVVVTPAAGFVQPGWALLLGIIGAIIVYWTLQFKKRYLHVDDTLDTFTCHGVGGIVGAFCTGLFCQTDVNSSGANGAFYGNPIQLWRQIAAILVAFGFCAACTAAILLPMHFTFGIKLTTEDQALGMDGVLHGESWNNNNGTASRSGKQQLEQQRRQSEVVELPTKTQDDHTVPTQKRSSTLEVLHDAFV
ncbi:unnamed protein product [Didymodactylos carnosus]|uniref:Ammonium transporter n=1 Tax=Didymodactylos carnosus TaxID=1234261 RepID=A0A8S2CUJ5_9BILA|nr:unnamed protein product [Didymodactylos carnosus]CAF3561443.1 unnamed protein product [Didymodactylos carnosus]CAF3838151.1 unnamed protein product [Didymodactylos carnosus]